MKRKREALASLHKHVARHVMIWLPLLNRAICSLKLVRALGQQHKKAKKSTMMIIIIVMYNIIKQINI